ncbi:MAG: hypothetical protein DSY92_01950 [Planctomycetota bacterium]|nr:MAG: hypothetical protein DSY92_01950 [Planctomycetota bacterium]
MSADLGIAHVAIQPLLEIVGELNDFASCGGEFCRGLVAQLAEVLAIAIRNYKLFAKVQRAAKIDSLTKLANHQTFFEILAKPFARRHDQEVSTSKELAKVGFTSVGYSCMACVLLVTAYQSDINI